MKVLDLFSGIGGFSLGLERAGMETVAFCEIDPYCRRVLAKHWPDVPCHEDITELSGEPYRGAVDLVCGGFPCQDISVAGKQAGIDGARSGLWGELARVLGEVRPAYAIVENTPALLSGDRGRWFQRVLGGLAALGYDAEWHCIPAAAVGAPHRRDRVWLVAYSCKPGLSSPQRPVLCGTRWRKERRAVAERGGWTAESDLVRVVHGLPGRVDRIKALGNSVVPQIVEIIGRAIMAVERDRTA